MVKIKKDSNFIINKGKNIDVSNSLLMLGFPTYGLVGGICSYFLINNFDMEEIASIDINPSSMVPTIVVEKAIPKSPIRIYSGDMICGPDGKCDRLTICVSDIPVPPNLLYEISELIIEWAKANKIKMILNLEGIPQQSEDKEIHFYGVSTESTVEILKKLDIKLLDGVITGFSASLMYNAKINQIDALSIFSNVHPDVADAEAASKMISKILPLLPKVSFDLTPLLEKAKIIESDMKEKVETHKDNINKLQRNPTMYQ